MSKSAISLTSLICQRHKRRAHLMWEIVLCFSNRFEVNGAAMKFDCGLEAEMARSDIRAPLGGKLLPWFLGFRPSSTAIGNGGYNVESKGPLLAIGHSIMIALFCTQVKFRRPLVKYIGHKLQCRVVETVTGHRLQHDFGTFMHVSQVPLLFCQVYRTVGQTPSRFVLSGLCHDCYWQLPATRLKVKAVWEV
jgi:hypothetical protein